MSEEAHKTENDVLHHTETNKTEGSSAHLRGEDTKLAPALHPGEDWTNKIRCRR